MNISGFSVKHPVTIVVLFSLFMGIALSMLPNLAIDLYPNTARPVLAIFTRFPGAGPADIAKNVTEPMERALASSRGLLKITSNSQFEFSRINLEYAYGTDMDQAVTDANTLVNRLVNTLPDGIDTPFIRRYDMAAMPIMRLVIKGNYPPDQLRIFAEDEIQSSVERIEGVANADIWGGNIQIVKVAVALNRLAAFNLTLGDITAALKGQSILSSGGSLRQGTKEYQIMTQEDLVNVDQIRRLVIKTVNTPAAGQQANRSQVVRLEDIADVNLGYDERANRVYVNSMGGVYLEVYAESDSNQVQVADRVKAALQVINAGLPRGLSVDVLTDNTTMIKATMGQVYSSAFAGLLLSMMIIFLVLRNIKGTLIIGLSIPISILLTVMCMTLFGFTLNLLTMTGLIMAMGMTTDASIVILENIYNYRSRGAKSEVAATLGSREMLSPIVASVATTLCVFIPLIIYKNQLEMMGQLFSDLIFTVVIALIVSLTVAISLVPSLSGAILKLHTRKQKPLKNPIIKFMDNTGENIMLTIEKGYKRGLAYCLSHRLLVLILVLALLVLSMLQFSSVGMNMYFRNRADDIVQINISVPQGNAQDETEALLFSLQELIKKEVRGYQNIVLTIRRSGTYLGTIQITLPELSRQIDTPNDIIEKLTPITNAIPGTKVRYQVGRSMGTTFAIEIGITSKDYDAIMLTADEILTIITRYLPEIENPMLNMDEGSPQLLIQVNRDRASAMGISVANIAQEILTAMDGLKTTTMTKGDRLIDIVVMLRDQDRKELPDLDAIFVMGKSGQRVPISNVVDIIERRAPSNIRRENRESMVRIYGDLAPGIAATDMQKILEATINENLVPREGVKIQYLGEAADINTYYGHFILIIATAIFLVFGVMAMQFESFVDPFIIFFTIPLLFIGVIWIYKVGNQAMTMFSAVGIVALVGVVVNTGIILVTYANMLRARGMSVYEACLEAGRSRLRPVIMSSFGTILAMTPIAFFPGAGAETIQPIGKTFVGGLLVSTFMTLFLTPVLYSLINSRHDKKREKEAARLAENGANPE